MSSTESGDTASGVTLAFNTIGWQSQNILFNAIDALLGDTLIGTPSPAEVIAAIEDTDVTATGNVLVKADNQARLNATISNAATSAASAFFNASGMSASAVLASNKVNTKTQAYIEDKDNSGTTSVSAGGNITIDADDQAGIYSNAKLVSSSTTTNDGGAAVIQETVNDFLDVDHTTTSTAVNLKYGDRVRLADDYAIGGKPGSVYEYLGQTGYDPVDGNTSPTDLRAVDYANTGYWREIPETNLVPQGLNVTGSDSIAIGGMVVYNDVRSDVISKISKATIASSGDVSVTANNDSTIVATADSTSSSSGGSAYGTGTSLAVNGVIATNSVLGSALASIEDSTVGTSVTRVGGNVDVHATNNASISATNTSATTSGDAAVGITIAFNTVGWNSQNILFSAVSTLLGAPLSSSSNPASTTAKITNSSVHANGDVVLFADNTAAISATLSNEATSAASALVNAGGMSTSGILSGNWVNSSAQAFIGTSSTVDANGSNSSYLDPASPPSTLSAGQRVRLATGEIYQYQGLNLTGSVDLTDATQEYATNPSWKQVASLSVTATDNATIDASTRLVSSSTTSNDGGAGILDGLISTFLDDYKYTSNSGTPTLKFGDRVRVADDFVTSVGSPVSDADPSGKVFQYMGAGGTSVDLGPAQDYTNYGLWKELEPTNIIPDGLNVTGSDSIGIGGLVVRNDVRSDVDAYVDASTITVADGDARIEAFETASIKAMAESTASSSGGSAYGTGTSLAVNGTIATNSVLSSADAKITGSPVTVRDANSGNTNVGNLSVEAHNESKIDAQVLGATSSGDAAVGVTLAFNTVGWTPSNIFANTLDALLGDSILGSAQPATTSAYIQNSTVITDGDLTLDAQNVAELSSKISNNATSAASALIGAGGMSASGVLASNMVNTKSQAYLNHAASRGTATVGGNVSITSDDKAKIIGDVNLVSASSTSNTGGLDLLSSAAATYLDGQYDYTTSSGTRDIGTPNYDHKSTDKSTGSTDGKNLNIKTGERVKVAYDYLGSVSSDHASSAGSTAVTAGDVVRIASGYTVQDHESNDTVDLDPGDVVLILNSFTGTGTKGSVYKYSDTGPAQTNVDLSALNYTTANWKKIAGSSGSDYQYIGSGATIDLSRQDYTDSSKWQAISGDDGTVYEFIPGDTTIHPSIENYKDEARWKKIGASNSTQVRIAPTYTHGSDGDIYRYIGGTQLPAANLGSIDYASDANWKKVTSSNADYIPNLGNVTGSDSVGIGGLVVRNDVRSDVDAYIHNTDLDGGGNVAVGADSAAQIQAKLSSKVSSSGGSSWGTGTSLAVNGTIATNLVQSSAVAKITSSEIGDSTKSV
ncbi:MAG: hypothetical protein MK077_10690, partial [Phycisphaerales bacterium]|nr:hypothetical protein [Phycisphaerales bacterium]